MSSDIMFVGVCARVCERVIEPERWRGSILFGFLMSLTVFNHVADFYDDLYDVLSLAARQPRNLAGYTYNQQILYRTLV
jgi:hypothetical protein